MRCFAARIRYRVAPVYPFDAPQIPAGVQGKSIGLGDAFQLVSKLGNINPASDLTLLCRITAGAAAY